VVLISAVFIISPLFCIERFGCKVAAQRLALPAGGAGVDSVWEQEKPEARKMLENAAESPASSARFVGQPRAYQNAGKLGIYVF
jgi:hypothetical protein